MDLNRRTWVSHIIIASGILLAGFIIVGYVKTMHLFLSPPARWRGHCDTCITLDDNNTRHVVRFGVDLVLELPAGRYPVEHVGLISKPPEIVELYANATPRAVGNWARTLHFVATGTTDIIVPSSERQIPDFHVTVIAQ
jgi:hypothetical protein